MSDAKRQKCPNYLKLFTSFSICMMILHGFSNALRKLKTVPYIAVFLRSFDFRRKQSFDILIHNFFCLLIHNSQMGSPLKSPTDETKSKQQIPTITIKSSPPRSKTQISSVYTKLSSIKPTTSANSLNNKHTSISSNNLTAKPMKSTKIEHPKTSPVKMQNSSTTIRGNEGKVPFKRTIPQLVKSTNGTSKSSSLKLQKPLSTSRPHIDDSNGNSATSSLSTSSSNSSLNATNVVKQNGKDVEFLTSQLNEIYGRGLID